MDSTLVYSGNGRLVVSKTLVETAKRMTDMKGAFHAKDILFALESQAALLESQGRRNKAEEVRKITERTVIDRLCYDNFSYKKKKPQYWRWIEKKSEGWFIWNEKLAE